MSKRDFSLRQNRPSPSPRYFAALSIVLEQSGGRIWILTIAVAVGLAIMLAMAKGTEAASFNDAATGDWNVGATWGNAGNDVEGSGYPGASDDATIDSHTVTLTASHSAKSVTISGGILTAGAYTLTVIGGNWTFSSGTFNYDTGTVDFVGDSIMTITGATTFYNLTFSATLNYTQSISDDLIVQNDLTITRTGTGLRILADGSETHTISVAGDVLHSGAVDMEGDLTVVMNGTTAQTVTTSSTGYIGSLQISNTSATVELGSNLLMAGTLTIDLNTTLDVTANNYSMTILAGWTRNGTFTQRQGTVDFVANIAMTITGATTFYNLTFSGTLPYNQSISDDLIVQNDLTITRTGTGVRILADGAETHTISVAGNVTHSGAVLMEGDLTVVMNGTTAQTVTTSSTGYIGSLQISNTSATVELGSNLLMAGTLTIDLNTTLDVTANNYSMTIQAGWTRNGTFTQRQGTVDFVANIAMTITGATTFYNLTFSGTLAYNQNISDDLIVQNDLTITRTGTGVRILADGAETHTISVAGNVTHSGAVLMEGDLTVVMNGTTAQTVTTSSTGYIGSLQISNTSATVELGSNLLMAGTLTIDLNTTLDVTANNYSMTIQAGWTRNGTFTQRQGTVDFVANIAMTITGATTFYNLTFSGTLPYNQSISDDLIVQNDLTITRTGTGVRILADGAETHTISVAGNVTHSGAVLMEGDITIVMNGTTTQTVTTSSTGKIGDLQISNTSAEVQLGATLLVVDDITVDASTTFDLVSYGITGSATLTAISNSGTIQLEGDQSFTYNSWTNSAGSTVEYTATSGSRAIQDLTYKSLKINGSGGTFTMGAGETLEENLTVSAGTFDVNDQTLSIDGTTTIDGGTMMTGTNTITFGDASGDTVTISSGELQIESDSTTADIVKTAGTWTNSGGTITYNAGTVVSTKLLSALSSYNNLTINSTGSTYTLDEAIDVNGNLTLTAGEVDVDNTGNYQINVAGDWSNSGTFTAQSGTVVFDGTNQTISGSTTFNNFSKTDSTNDATDLTLTFDNTGTQTISGLITLDGLDDDDRINLVSDSPDTQWSLTCNGTFAIDYVDVQDSDASGGTTISHTNTVNSGNNLNWGFEFANAIFFGINF